MKADLGGRVPETWLAGMTTLKLMLAAMAAALLAPAAALANAPAQAPLPDFPPDARPGECWARAPIGELAGAPADAPAQQVWTLKRGHGPEAVWRFDVRPAPDRGVALEPGSDGPYQWVRVACHPGEAMAEARPPHGAHPMPAGPRHPEGMRHHEGMQHHEGMSHHEGMKHHEGMEHGRRAEAGAPPHAMHGPRPQARAFVFHRRLPPPPGFDAPPPGFDGPPPGFDGPPPGFQGPPPPMAFAAPQPYPEQPPRWFGDRFLTWSGKTW